MYTKIEEEIIFLNAITDLIDEMVNHTMFIIVGDPPDQEIRFHTSIHQKLFNILLVDLLSKSDKKLVGKDELYTDALKRICDQPSFIIDDSIHDLQVATSTLIDWLGTKMTAHVWLPSLDADVHLSMERSTFIRICGNLSKHSFLRQSWPAQQLKGLLEQAGKQVSLAEATLALEEFYERFHTDILNYHGSTIVEMLNAIQWGVHEYLLPQYRRSHVSLDEEELGKYRLDYPEGITSAIAKSLYWDLMNDVRRKPYVEKFSATKYLKMRY